MTQKASKRLTEAEFQKKQKRQKWIAFWIAAYFVSLFLPLISPYTKYPLYVVICGGKLPMIGTNFAAAYSYSRPGESTYELTPFITHMFCSDEEANRAGFHPRN